MNNTNMTTPDIVDILYQRETTDFDNCVKQFNNSSKIKFLFLRCKENSSWFCDTNELWGPDIDAEYIIDILTSDGKFNDIDFLSIPSNFNISNITKIDILAYSSNIYSVDYILNIIDQLKPSVLFHLSDEFTNRYDYISAFNKVKLVYRQYKLDNENNDKIKYLPVGYHSWGKYYMRTNIKPITERKYKWCFSGSNKGNRLHYLDQLSVIQPHYNNSTKPYETSEMFNNSKFAFCPNGNYNIENSRIYEAMYNGCIPIIISDLNNINNFKNMFELKLPCYFVETIDEMINIINNVSDEELQIKQNNCIQWCKNMGTIIRNNVINITNNTNEPLIESFMNTHFYDLDNIYYLFIFSFILILIIILYKRFNIRKN
jgi:hypothetical protein